MKWNGENIEGNKVAAASMWVEKRKTTVNHVAMNCRRMVEGERYEVGINNGHDSANRRNPFKPHG